MITLLFIIICFAVFGEIIGFAIKASWSILKVLFTIVFLPVIIIGVLLSGLVSIALPVLVIFGIAMLVKNLIVA